jgi:hypothetical protein
MLGQGGREHGYAGQGGHASPDPSADVAVLAEWTNTAYKDTPARRHPDQKSRATLGVHTRISRMGGTRSLFRGASIRNHNHNHNHRTWAEGQDRLTRRIRI